MTADILVFGIYDSSVERIFEAVMQMPWPDDDDPFRRINLVKFCTRWQTSPARELYGISFACELNRNTMRHDLLMEPVASNSNLPAFEVL